MTTLLVDDVVSHPEIEPLKRSFELVSEYHPGLATSVCIATSGSSGAQPISA